ncbi:hypothetical protein [Jannaschia sp. R86511]|uniref:hypothetical protein n=1 Tax=Jannaschia sp. R86511 TaxID=3093853 RepID=UPI0036D299B2
MGTAIEFGSDPLGYIADALRGSVQGLVSVVLPALSQYTLPDFSADWFLRIYAFSYGLAVLLFVCVLAWELLKLTRGTIAGDDFIETMLQWTPAFFLGATFGPAVMAALTGVFSALGELVFGVSVTSGTETVIAQLDESVGQGDVAGIAGGAIMAIVVYVLLFCGVLGALLIMIVQGVALYCAGALFPLGWAWVASQHRRGFGTRLPMVIVGILASHALLFLMLGVAFQLAGGLATNFDDPGLQILVNLFTAAMAMILAGLSPLLLLKFAPVLPMGSGPTSSARLMPSPRVPEGSPQDSELARAARSTPDSSSGGGSSGSSDGAGAGDRGAGSSAGGRSRGPGRLEQAARASQQAGSGPGGSPGGGTAGGGKVPAGAGAGSSAGSSRAASAAGGSGAGAGVGAGAGAAAGAGAGTGAGAGAGAGAAAGGTAAAAAGAGATSTGVGAAVGIPLMAVGLAAAAAAKTEEFVEQHAQDAPEAMRFGERDSHVTDGTDGSGGR